MVEGGTMQFQGITFTVLPLVSRQHAASALQPNAARGVAHAGDAFPAFPCLLEDVGVSGSATCVLACVCVPVQGPTFKFPMSLYPWGMWMVSMDRCDITHPSLLALKQPQPAAASHSQRWSAQASQPQSATASCWSVVAASQCVYWCACGCVTQVQAAQWCHHSGVMCAVHTA